VFSLCIDVAGLLTVAQIISQSSSCYSDGCTRWHFYLFVDFDKHRQNLLSLADPTEETNVEKMPASVNSIPSELLEALLLSLASAVTLQAHCIGVNFSNKMKGGICGFHDTGTVERGGDTNTTRSSVFQYPPR